MMYVSTLVALLVQLAASALCMKITVKEGDIICNVLSTTEEKAEEMNGSQAFVRLVKILECPSTFAFKVDDIVAVKFARNTDKRNIAAMSKEQANYALLKEKLKNPRRISKVGGPGNVTRDDISNDEIGTLRIPVEETEFEKFSVYILQRLFQNLLTVLLSHKSISEKSIQLIMSQLDEILTEFETIGFVHGDIKLENIVLVEDDKIEGGICLIDFGLSYFIGSSDVSYGGDITYRSMRTMKNYWTEDFPASTEDDKFSSTVALIAFAGKYFPWMQLCVTAYNLMKKENLNQAEKTQFLQLCSDIIDLKINFKFSDYPNYDSVPPGIKDTLMTRLLTLRDGYVDPVLRSSAISEYDSSNVASASTSNAQHRVATNGQRKVQNSGCVPLKLSKNGKNCVIL